MILRRLILTPRLPAVVPVAQGLPVASVPEEFLVTAVRNDVVNVRCLHVPSFLHALHTQRMCFEVLPPGFLPGCSVSPSCGGPYLFRVHRFVPLAELLPRWDKRSATGMPAWLIRLVRHLFKFLSIGDILITGALIIWRYQKC